MYYSIYSSLQTIEDEQHFPPACPLYQKERHILIETCMGVIDNFMSFDVDVKFEKITQSCRVETKEYHKKQNKNCYECIVI